jgi:hypothetical protein
MHLITPPPSAAPVGLSAMTMVARAAQGGLVDTHRTLLDTIQRRDIVKSGVRELIRRRPGWVDSSV